MTYGPNINPEVYLGGGGLTPKEVQKNETDSIVGSNIVNRLTHSR